MRENCSHSAQAIYINWSLNSLLPIYTGAGDRYLKLHKPAILSESRRLLAGIDYQPSIIYRGLILQDNVSEINPHKNFEYLSFSDDYNVARHFADPINGFGKDIIDLKTLGEYGYIIEYTPRIEEVLFHYKFLDIIEYEKYINAIGINGKTEIEGLKKQKEIMILQPETPFTKINKYESSTIREIPGPCNPAQEICSGKEPPRCREE